MFANSLMLPYFDCLDIIWNKTYKTNLNKLDILYKKIAKIALNYYTLESSMKVYKDMKWLPLHLPRQLHMSTYMFKIINGNFPPQLRDKFVYITGGSRMVTCAIYTQINQKLIKKIYCLGAKCWNILPQPLILAESAKTFSNTLKCRLLHNIEIDERYVVNNSYNYIYKHND